MATSLKNQIALYLVDHKIGSTKQIWKYTKCNRKSLSNIIYTMKKDGLIEHNGYQRYQLTDKGHAAAAGLFTDRQTLKKPEDVKPAAAESAIPVIQAQGPGEIAFWQEEARYWRNQFVEIAKKLAGGGVRLNEPIFA